MNDFLSYMTFCCLNRRFPAETCMCANSKIYQLLVQCSMSTCKWIEHYNVKFESWSSLEPLRSHFNVALHFPWYINKNEQHQIAWHNDDPHMFFFLPNKLSPFSVVSLFGFSTSICPPRHHENSPILSGWKLQEYLALSPEDCGTN